MRSLTAKETYIRDVARLLSGFIASGNTTDLLGYLTAEGGLPGADPELTGAFTGVVREFAAADPDDRRLLWDLCIMLADIPPEGAPASDLHELLISCGIRGIGTIGSLSPACAEPALTRLAEASADPRQRIREAAGMGVRDILSRQRDTVIPELARWVEGGSWLTMRAAIMGIVEPDLLGEPDIPTAAFHLHRKVLIRIYTARERQSEAFGALRMTLGSTLAPVIAALPGIGFEYLRQLATLDDPDIRWIVRENLRESGLQKRYPETVRHIGAQIG